MTLKERHAEIIHILKQSEAPVSGSSLSKQLGVSRQIIVSDIETIRADGNMILSTPKGYVIIPTQYVERVFKVYHTVEDTESELNLIVDLGAEVKDVFISHHVYNEIHAKLNIASRHDVSVFCDNIKSGKSSPLLTITGGYHYHTIAAKDTETLTRVEEALREKGFLAPLTEYEPAALTRYFENN
ncbi:MAG: transcription repressor NadR [Lachnospiraceae bacterium]|nr:transcription repressor NadR [Lachnospiraceae bacterium]